MLRRHVRLGLRAAVALAAAAHAFLHTISADSTAFVVRRKQGGETCGSFHLFLGVGHELPLESNSIIVRLAPRYRLLGACRIQTDGMQIAVVETFDASIQHSLQPET
jgi:hypothetical protein